MDYLRITDNKLKITLTEEEVLFYGMDLSALSYSSTETRRAFWAILDDAKHATGFDAAASRVSVQVYASRSGGCEMYIIGGEGGSEEEEAPHDNALALTAQTGTKCESGLTVAASLPRRFERTVGEFSRLADLLSACNALHRWGYDGESMAYRVGDCYYLYLSGSPGDNAGRNEHSGHGKGKSKKGSLSATGVVWEFGTPAEEHSLSYLREHGIPLCDQNAVETLCRL